jgi:probable HAF family extracellular repeat protein
MVFRRSALLWTIALTVTGFLTGPRAAGTPPYVFVNLSSGGTSAAGRAYGVNRYGQVVGYTVSSEGLNHATHWYNDASSDLHGTTHLQLNQDFTVGAHEVYAISDADQIVGTGQVDLDCPSRTVRVYHAMVIRPAVLTDLGTPVPGDAVTDLWTFGNPCTAYNSAATGISNANHVVGWADVDNAATIRAFLVRPQNGVWYLDADANGVNDLLIDLGTLGGAESSASDVNDAGFVTGYSFLAITSVPARYHAFLLQPSGTTWFADADGDGANDLMQSVGTLGGNNSWGRSINNANVIVGEADTSDFKTHAFRWESGAMVDLGTLGGRSSSAADISDTGVIVGWAEDALGRRRACIWINGVAMDLNSNLLFGSSANGVTMTEARGINEEGHVVGFGSFGTGDTAQTRPFLLRPATAAEIVTAQEAQAATTMTAGATSSGASSGGPSLGQGGGTAIIGTPSTVQPRGSSAAAGAQTESGPQVMPALCGFGVASFLPLTAAGLIGLRRGLRARA